MQLQHLLGIEYLTPQQINTILDLANHYANKNRTDSRNSNVLSGCTQVNMFFENSTRTQASFEIAGKRLGADVMNMSMEASSVKKGETLVDTALTLNAMHPDLLVVRHPHSGAVALLAQKVNCAVINAGDGQHEHPTQALLDALTIRRSKGRLHRAEVYHDMQEGLKDVDVVMMLRLQSERMDGGFIPSEREYYHRYGLDAGKLSYAKPDAIVMHPGPMNRGIEIDGEIADDLSLSVIQEQVEMGVAVRMAAMEILMRNSRQNKKEANE